MDTFKNVVEDIKHSVETNTKKEGGTTKKIEKVTSAIPSSTWLMLGGGAVLGSLALKLVGRDQAAAFVGQWVPTLLLLGIYNKIVKVMGSDHGDVATTH